MTKYRMPKPPKGMFWEISTSPHKREIHVALKERSLWGLFPPELRARQTTSASLNPDFNARAVLELAQEMLQEFQDLSAYDNLNGLTGYVRV